MTRSKLIALVVMVPACFSEGDVDGATAGEHGSSSDSGADVTTMPTTTTADATGTTDATSASTAGTSTTTDTSPDSTGADACNWGLEWNQAPGKDIVVVAYQPEPEIGDPLLINLASLAWSMATLDGHHVAWVGPCPLMMCPDTSAWFEVINVPAMGDTVPDVMALAADHHPSDGFFRPNAPKHWVMFTTVDTGWAPMDLMGVAEPHLRTAQIDARIFDPDTSCSPFSHFDALAEATHGSISCAEVTMQSDVLDDRVIGPQPGCVIDPTSGPLPGGASDLLLTLAGDPGSGMTMLVPDGPHDCANQPGGWDLADAASGPVILCPDLCRNVSVWQVGTLTADLSYSCPL